MFINRLFNKETAIQSVKIVFIFQILLVGIGFVRGVLFARILGPSQYGIFTLAFMLVSLVSPFIILGITGSLSRYIPKYEQKGMLTDFLKRVQWFPLISSFFFSVICIIYAAQISQLIFNTAEYSTLVVIVSITIVPTIIYQLIWSTLWGLRNFLVRSLLELSYGVLLFGLGLFFILKQPLAESVIIGNVWAYLIVVILFGLLIRKYVFQREDQKNKLDKTNLGLYKEVINFGFWLILANLAFTALHYIDRWMLNRYVGAAEVGIYAVAMGLTAFLFLGVQLVGNVLSVNLNYLWEQGEREQCMSVLNTVVKTMLFLFLVGSFFILLLKDFIIGTLYGIEYLPGANIIYILLFMQVFMVIYWIIGTYPSLIEKTSIVFLAGAIGLISNVGLNYLLIPLYQMKGAAIASASSFLLISVVLLILNKAEKFKVDKKLFLLILVSLLLLLDHVWIFGVVLGLLCMASVKTSLIFSDLEKKFMFEKLKEGFRW
jgi:O-antigen/teichoic acid export membrane protein